MVSESSRASDGSTFWSTTRASIQDALAVRVKDGKVTMMTDEQWDAVLSVNLKRTFLCSQCAAVPMMAQRYGRIVNTSSISALGNIGQANYAASKSGSHRADADSGPRMGAL